MCFISFFFFNDTATTEIYTLSLHDALPIYPLRPGARPKPLPVKARPLVRTLNFDPDGKSFTFIAQKGGRSEEHTSELQSRQYLVCRLLLEKKKKNHKYN